MNYVHRDATQVRQLPITAGGMRSLFFTDLKTKT